MLEKVLIILFLLSIPIIGYSETIQITCKLNTKKYPSQPFNVTVLTPPDVKTSKVLFDDENIEVIYSENLRSWVEDIYVTKSEIKFKSYVEVNKKIDKNSYSIKRSTGYISTLFFPEGATLPTMTEVGNCSPRVKNKF